MSLSLAKPAVVGDVMSASVYTLYQDDTLKEAAVMLASAKISGAPVVDAAGSLIGILTEGDILKSLERESDKAKLVPEDGYSLVLKMLPFKAIAPRVLVALSSVKVMEAMSRPVVSTTMDTSLDQAAYEMTERMINRLPVVEEGRIVGIVSRADIVRALAKYPLGKT